MYKISFYCLTEKGKKENWSEFLGSFEKRFESAKFFWMVSHLIGMHSFIFGQIKVKN